MSRPHRSSPGNRCFRVLRGSLFKWPRGPFSSCRYHPTHTDYSTVWLRRDPYTLTELRKHIPRGWRRPAKACTDIGRNCQIFRSLLRYAGVEAHSDEDVAVHADRLYQDLDIYNPHTFGGSELSGVLRSVMRYRKEWRANGWHQPSWTARQAERGRRNSSHQQAQKGVRSGEARRERTEKRNQRILEALDAGLSTRAVAAMEGISQPRIVQIRQRVAAQPEPPVRRRT